MYFLFPRKSGGMRPAINLKRLNSFVAYEHFKMEAWHTVKETIWKRDYLAKTDLSGAYLTVPIHPSHRKYLQFEWKGDRWQFSCLPFGLSSAPRVFIKIVKPILSHFRGLGIRIVAYLRDLILVSDPTSLRENVESLIEQHYPKTNFSLRGLETGVDICRLL